MAQDRSFRMGHYVLDDNNNAVPWPDQKLLKWAQFFEEYWVTGRNIVKQEYVANTFLSTVFLGIDMSHFRILHPDDILNHDPLIFETMAFYRLEGENDIGQSYYVERYPTWDLALKGHEEKARDIHATYCNTQKD